MNALALEKKQLEIYERHNFVCPLVYITCRKPDCPLPIVSLCPRFPKWCLRFYCPICKKYMNICMICVKERKEYKAVRSVKERTLHDALHPNDEPEKDISTSSEEDDIYYEATNSDTDSTNDGYDDDYEYSAANDNLKRKLTPINDEALRDILTDHAAYNFFKNNDLELGKNFLLTRQLSKCNETSNLHQDDVDLHILLSFLFFRLTKSERLLFSRVTRYIIKKYTREERVITTKDISSLHSHTSSPITKSVSIPWTEAEMRRYSEGKYSIQNNLPIPKILTTPNGSSFVLPSDVLKIYFSFGIKPHMIKTLNEIQHDNKNIVGCAWECRRAKQILEIEDKGENDVNNILMVLWSDGFDPNDTKDNRGSAHIITFTLLSNSNKNDRNLSFICAVSSDKEDHNEIRRRLYEDIADLSTTKSYYDGDSIFKARIFHFITIEDRPQRSDSTGFGHHNGLFTGRWGYRCTFDEKIFSCSSCIQNRMKNIGTHRSRNCIACYDWDYTKHSFSLPSDYPIVKENKLKGCKTTFRTMLSCVDVAYEKYKEKKWNTKNVVSYLKSNCLSMVLIDDILKDWDEHANDNNYNHRQKLPSVWFAKNVEMHTHIDTIMHLVFLGITQKLGMIVKQILTKHNKYSMFHSYNNIHAVVRDMNLDWCKLLPFGSSAKPFSTWVSENCLAFVRVIKSIYSALDDLIDDEELTESIFYLINMWQATVARIMKKQIDDKHINDTERHIKMFLSCLRDMENCYSLTESKKKNMFETTPNLNGLLNLPDFMWEYGPLRLYWEGGFMGEGIIKYVKPCITQGTYKSTFASNALRRFYKERFFQTLTNIDLEDGNINKAEIRYTKFRTYKNRQIVEDLLSHEPHGSPISIIVLKNNDICFSCTEGVTHQTVKLVPNDKQGRLWYGTWITNMHIGDIINISKADLMMDSNVMGYGLALPILTKNILHDEEKNNNGPFFHVITNEWTERMLVNNKIIYNMPRVFGCSY